MNKCLLRFYCRYATYILFFIFIAYSVPVKATDFELIDKSNRVFTIEQSYDLKHGLAHFRYYLQEIANDEIKLLLFEGKIFGDSEACPASRDHHRVILDEAVLYHKYDLADINQDGYQDIIFHLTDLLPVQ